MFQVGEKIKLIVNSKFGCEADTSFSCTLNNSIGYKIRALYSESRIRHSEEGYTISMATESLINVKSLASVRQTLPGSGECFLMSKTGQPG